jgi:hypothetical protein
MAFPYENSLSPDYLITTSTPLIYFIPFSGDEDSWKNDKEKNDYYKAYFKLPDIIQHQKISKIILIGNDFWYILRNFYISLSRCNDITLKDKINIEIVIFSQEKKSTKECYFEDRDYEFFKILFKKFINSCSIIIHSEDKITTKTDKDTQQKYEKIIKELLE